MELIVPPHGANSEKVLSKEREGTFTGARRRLNRKENDEKTAFLLQK
jgi:hypothetical protein